jgi:signal transduction histidine kinase
MPPLNANRNGNPERVPKPSRDGTRRARLADSPVGRDGAPRPLARVGRQLAPHMMVIFVAAALTAILGPLLSYQSDVAEVREQAHQRVARDAHLYADALSHHLAVLGAELARLAERPEVDMADGRLAPEQALLEVSHRSSALFVRGVAFVNDSGRVVGSQPSPLHDLGPSASHEAWFQELLKTGAPAYGLLQREQEGLLAISAPIMRDRKMTGAIVGVVGAFQSALPRVDSLGETRIALFDQRDQIVAFGELAPWMEIPGLTGRLRALGTDGRAGELGLDGGRFVAAAPVGTTGLQLMLLAREDPLLAPIRSRFILQFALISAVQLGAVLMLAAFLRLIYRRFLFLEAQANRQERLADLGRASSLIAHEIKNSLNSINAALTLLGDSGEAAAPVGVLRGQVDRLRHLGTSLLQFAKPAAARLAVTQLAPLVAETVDGLKSTLPEAADVAVSSQLDPSVHAACDSLLLITAVDNLVRNAMEAAAAARDVGHTAEPKVAITLAMFGPKAAIMVEDNAGGLAPEAEGKLFEPFATSKSKGIGLGLSMARRAVEEQGGVLRFEQGESGLRFIIELQSKAQP